MPFDRKESRFELWKKIVEMAYLWKIESITFGGGDPYVYPRFPDLLRYTYDQFSGKIFIQVDTNGMRMNKSHYRLLSETNSLLGLPLDGSTEEINEMIRSNPYIHRNTLRHLESLKEHKVNTKINTLVCNHNISDITNIAKILTRYDVSVWSLYEFWPIEGVADINRKQFELSHDEYLNLVESVSPLSLYSDFEIEWGSVDERKNGYFFVTETGKVYTIHKSNRFQYQYVGNISDDDILSSWNMLVDKPTAQKKRVQQRLNSIQNKHLHRKINQN